MTSILVVDDDRQLVNSIRTALTLDGFEVLVSYNVAATAVYAVDIVDLILSDWWLPDGNASDVQTLFPTAPLIIMTADTSIAQRERERGILCLVKPVSIPVIIETIHRLLG